MRRDHLGSWNTSRPRPCSLSLEHSGTLPSPWTTGHTTQPRHGCMLYAVCVSVYILTNPYIYKGLVPSHPDD